MPQDATANPTPQSDDVASRLDALEAENKNLRQGVNPLIDENKALKEQLDGYSDKLETATESTEQSEDLTAEYDRLDIATNTKLREEIQNVKKELKQEEEIKNLNLGEHAETLKSLMRLPENNGLAPHEVAERHSLGDLAKIEEAKSRGIIGRSPDQKDMSNPDNIDFTDREQYQRWINANSAGGGNGVQITI